jgi:hypothetical protein
MKTKLIALLSVIALAVYVLTSFVPAPIAEKFKVIKVNGEILVKASGKNLVTGDEYLETTPLDFRTQESRAAVISPSKGRYVLTAQAQTGKTNMIPGMNAVSSRAGALLNMIDLQNHFTGNYVILDQTKLKISKESYPMSEKNFFFIRFEYNGETINKKLRAEGDSLVIERAAVFNIDGKAVAETEKLSCSLFYRKSETSENIGINSFTAVFPELKNLHSEVQIVLDNCANKKQSEKIDEVNSYIVEFYGKADRDNLVSWMKKNFKLN